MSEKRKSFKIHGDGDEILLQEMMDDEARRINECVEIERQWWGGSEIDNEAKAIRDGILVVLPERGSHYNTIARIRIGLEPKTLNVQAFVLLGIIQKQWAQLTRSSMVSTKDILLSVSSLYRSAELQNKIVASSYRASTRNSSHRCGAAIDFDPNGYYGTRLRVPIQSYKASYVGLYTDKLLEVLVNLHNSGACNLVIEKGIRIEEGKIITYDACYHVCASPQFKPSDI